MVPLFGQVCQLGQLCQLGQHGQLSQTDLTCVLEMVVLLGLRGLHSQLGLRCLRGLLEIRIKNSNKSVCEGHNKLTLSGRDLGSGHFCYFAKHFFVKI